MKIRASFSYSRWKAPRKKARHDTTLVPLSRRGDDVVVTYLLVVEIQINNIEGRQRIIVITKTFLLSTLQLNLIMMDSSSVVAEENGIIVRGGRTRSQKKNNMLRNDHRFQTKFAFIMTIATIVLLAVLSILYKDDNNNVDDTQQQQQLRWLEDANTDDDNNNSNNGDYSQFSCRNMYEKIPDAGVEQCNFAKTCNEGDGVWAPFVFCQPLGLSVTALFSILSPVMIIWMVTLFRLLGTTAEDYFSPSLEMFSVKLGLPPRFAGVTLLALGNGAADVSATMSAIVSDAENGYKLSLGALTGASMFVGCVVAGIVIVIAEGVTCRGALVRDVAALAITVGVVWANLSSGVVTPSTTSLFLSLYGFFVLIVLVADIYHRAVVLPRLAAAAALADAENGAGSTLDGNPAHPSGTVNPPNAFMRFVTAFSNYDNPCERDTTVPAASSSESLGGNTSQENLVASDGMTGIQAGQATNSMTSSLSISADEPIILHGSHGILHGDGRVPPSSIDSFPSRTAPSGGGSGGDGVWNTTTENGGTGGSYTLVEDHIDQMCISDGSSGVSAHNWKGAWHDGKKEVKDSIEELWEDIAFNGDLKLYEKVLLVCELPFTLLRKVRIHLSTVRFFKCFSLQYKCSYTLSLFN